MANPLRVSTELNNAPLNSYRIAALALCVMITVVDGLDFVAIGVVAPLMMDDVGMTPGGLGLVIALTQVGAAIGALSLGRAADRFGRKPLMVLSLLLISLFTFMTATSTDYPGLLAVRFAAGIALTGVLPATLALVSELAPERARGTVTAIVVAGFPLGAALGSLGGAPLAEAAGWRSVFYVGALLPLGLAGLVLMRVPESPRYLALNDHTGVRLAQAMSRLAPHVDAKRLWEPMRVLAGSAAESARRSASILALLGEEFGRRTVLLWGLLFCSGVLSNFGLVWMPTLFAQAGYSLTSAAVVVGALNIGATLGMAVAGRILDSLGAPLTIGAAFVVAAAATLGIGITVGTPGAVVSGAILGFFLGVTTSAGYAVSAQIYPTALRSTGVGGGAAALRIGTVVAPLLAPFLIGLSLPMVWTFGWVALVPAIAAVIAWRFSADNSPAAAAAKSTAA